ncbi:carboxypeptidase-like regulatory domain-containing protein [Flavitalea flava]
MRYILFFLVIFIFSATAFSQTGTNQPAAKLTGAIKGMIRTADGYPAESVSVAIKGTAMVTLSDKTGNLEIKMIKPGIYILLASFAGHTARELRVEVKTNETTIVPEVVLNENTLELKEVVISGNRFNKGGEYVAKMPLKNMENPSGVQHHFLRDIQIAGYYQL